jgi:hypothetical protein
MADTPTPAQPPTDPAAAPPPPGGTATVDQRLAAQDAKIESMGGKLDQVLDRLTGGHPPGEPAPAPGKSVADQVREGVAAIEKEKTRKAAADKTAAADQAWRASVDQRLAEHRPAEPQKGSLTRLQRILFGHPDPQ